MSNTISITFIEMIYLRSDCVSPLLNAYGGSIERSLFTDTQLDSGFCLFCWTELVSKLSKIKKKQTDL